MSPLLRIPIGLIIMVVGLLIVLKTEKVFEWFGENDFAERRLGSGGTRFFYKLIGIAIVFIGIFTATNVISDVLGGVARVLTHSK